MPELIPAEPGTPEWHAARRAGVTATDIVTILGLSSYDSVYSLFWRKLGQVPDVEDNDRFRLGRELESYIAKRWHEANPGYGAAPSRLYRHSERAWQLATLDREIWKGTSHPFMPLECKSWADADRHSWGAGIYTGRVGDAGENLDPEPALPRPGQIPAQVRAQVLWQMDVMDVPVGHAGVLFLPSGEFRSYVIEHQRAGGCKRSADYVMIERGPCSVCDDLDLMRAAGEEFMARLRLELPPPDPDSSAATLAAVRARFAKVPDKEAEINPDVWYAFEAARDDLDHAKEEAWLWEINVRVQAGEASVLTVDGQPVARRIVSDAQVKAHTRHSDYLRRIIPRGDDDE